MEEQPKKASKNLQEKKGRGKSVMPEADKENTPWVYVINFITN